MGTFALLTVCNKILSNHSFRVGGFKDFFIFNPICGKMIPFDIGLKISCTVTGTQKKEWIKVDWSS